jgi:3-hydroxybutyrate dehydrogenase
MGVPADIDGTLRHETDFKVRAVHSPADMAKRPRSEMISLVKKPGSVDILSTMPASSSCRRRGVSAREMGTIIAINLSSAFYGIRAGASMKKRGWGRIINTASRIAGGPVSSRPMSGQARRRRLTKTALGLRPSRSPATALAPAMSDPVVEKQIPDTMKARNLTKEQVINDVLLQAQPTKEFVTSEQVAALALFLCGDDAAQITGANLSIDGGWTAA